MFTGKIRGAMAEEADPDLTAALPAEGERSHVESLLEEAARILGFGQYPSTMEVVLDRGPTVSHVYRKDRLRPAELRDYDSSPV